MNDAYKPGSWRIYPVLNGKRHGFVVLRGTRGEALDRDGNEQFDGTRPDCFFPTEALAKAAIAKATGATA